MESARIRQQRHVVTAIVACTLFASAGLVAMAARAGDGAGSAPPASAAPPDQTNASGKAPPTLPSVHDATPIDLPGIHNAVAYHEGLISGGQPVGDAAFDALAALGVKTIISVDGAVPDVARAEARGMRYIHLPISYNAFDEKRKLQLARAVRDGMEKGPVFLHCHHGKHRSAGALGAAVVTLGLATPEAMVARMKVSGTSPSYKGLYAVVQEATPVPKERIDAVDPDFPRISRPSNFVQGMVEMDEIWDNLRLIEKAGWNAPASHPGLVPAAEAGRLAEVFRHLRTLPYTQRKPEDFRGWMEKDHERAQLLERELASASPDLEAIAAAFKALGASCKECHAAYRD